jgi:hypothetical protein
VTAGTHLLEVEALVEEVLHEGGVVLLVLAVLLLRLLRVRLLLALGDQLAHLVVEDLVDAPHRRHLCLRKQQQRGRERC